MTAPEADAEHHPYDEVTSFVQCATGADVVALLVANGIHGSKFCLFITGGPDELQIEYLVCTARALRTMAADLDAKANALAIQVSE